MHSFVIYNNEPFFGLPYMSMDFGDELLRLRRQWCEKRAERWSVPSVQPTGAAFIEGMTDTQYTLTPFTRGTTMHTEFNIDSECMSEA